MNVGVLRYYDYWHLFHAKPYELRGKQAREQLLNYYDGNHSWWKALEAVMRSNKKNKQGHGPLPHAKVLLVRCWIMVYERCFSGFE